MIKRKVFFICQNGLKNIEIKKRIKYELKDFILNKLIIKYYSLFSIKNQTNFYY